MGFAFDWYFDLHPPSRVIELRVGGVGVFIDDAERAFCKCGDSSTVGLIGRVGDHRVFPFRLMAAWLTVFDLPTLGLDGGSRLPYGVRRQFRFL